MKDKIPKMFFINKMDEENADYDKVFNQLRDTFGNSVVAAELPIIEGGKFTGCVNVVSMKAYKFGKDKLEEIEIPSDLKDKVEEARNTLNEAVAETDEELMEKFFDGQEFTAEEINKGIKAGVENGFITPVFVGSAVNNMGVKNLMDSIIDLLPDPANSKGCKGKKERF